MKATPRGHDTRSAVRALSRIIRQHTAALQQNTAACAAVCESQAKQYQILRRIEKNQIEAYRGEITVTSRGYAEDWVGLPSPVDVEMPSTVDNYADPVKERVVQIEERLSGRR
jgi:hypothetical protein